MSDTDTLTPADVIERYNLQIVPGVIATTSPMTGGTHYKVSVSREVDGLMPVFEVFDFHGSQYDKERGAAPKAEDVLDALLCDVRLALEFDGLTEDEAADAYADEFGYGMRPSEVYRVVRGVRDTRKRLARVIPGLDDLAPNVES